MHLKSYLSRLLALLLVFLIGSVSFPAEAAELSGNYGEDTLNVIETITTAIDLSPDAPNKSEIQAATRQEINDYIARYRRKDKSSGLRSFTTMQTALNAVAGYYTSYGSRPLPEKLKKRLKQEFKQAQFAIERGN